MKPLHWVIGLFWLFVAVMILKQCSESNAARDEQAAHEEKHYFFVTPPAPAYLHPPSPNADVQQIAFTTVADTPTPGSFTCNVTLKNMGSKKATGVQVAVRPFRGGRANDDNVGHRINPEIKDTDPLGEMVQWVGFPDLAPGEQSTQSAVFLSRLGIAPGVNANPEIDFVTAKDPSNP